MSTLKEGDKAPVFTGRDQDGNPVSLADYKGKKLILFFYPKDNTPSCTAAACNLRDHYSELKEKGFALLGVSPDSERKHLNFIKKYKFPFPLIADTEHEILDQYEAWGDKQLFGYQYQGVLRSTFVIDENGKIAKIFRKVDTGRHTEQILEAMEGSSD